MIIKRKQIINILQDLWPHLVDGHTKPGHIWIPRNSYYAPTRQQFENMVNASWNPIASNISYLPDLFMCSNFSAALAVIADFYVLRLLAMNQLDPAVKAEWAIGETWGTKFHGDDISHAVCLVFLDVAGLLESWFMEPQPERRPNGTVDFRTWKADPEKDKIHLYKL